MHPIPKPVSTSEPATPAVVALPPVRPPADVLVSVCSAYGVTLDALLGPSRSRWIGKARIAAAAELRAMGMSFPDIGAVLGRHHTTVMYMLGGCRK